MNPVLQNFMDAQEHFLALKQELLRSTRRCDRTNRELLRAYEQLEALARIITGLQPDERMQFAEIG